MRYEWAPDGQFEDRPSAFAARRIEAVTSQMPIFQTCVSANNIEITTRRFHLTYDRREFSPGGLYVRVWGHTGDLWRFGEESETLGGTFRTLDGVDGHVELGPGVVSRRGFANVDDSHSMLFTDNGFVAPRRLGTIDGYLCYGHDYCEAVWSLYRLSGPQPLLPRWSLGNWWSRYHAYPRPSQRRAASPRRRPRPHHVAVRRAWQPPVSRRLLGRHGRVVVVAGLPAQVHGHGQQHRLRLVVARHRRPHAGRPLPPSDGEVGAAGRPVAHDAPALDQEPLDSQGAVEAAGRLGPGTARRRRLHAPASSPHPLPAHYERARDRPGTGELLVQPMYWDHPERNEAYNVPTQYMFGSEMMVAPITTPQNASTHTGKARAWLPPGTFVDFFTGVVYD